jgi:hypothetical protein
VVEDDRLTMAPILVEDLNAVLRGDRAHALDSFLGIRVRGGSSEVSQMVERHRA